MKKILSVLLVLATLCAAIPAAFAAEDTWICPTCGRECERNFCTNDRTPRPAPPQTLGRDAKALYNEGLAAYNAGDYTTAVARYTEAAGQGYAKAQFNLGYCYEKGRGIAQDYTKAVEWYTKAAEQGDATAQYNLGFFYEDGWGIAQDYTRAVEWYKKSAEQGFAPAQYMLGACYEYGNGVQKDLEKAQEWYQKAADQGYKNAKSELERLQRNR